MKLSELLWELRNDRDAIALPSSMYARLVTSGNTLIFSNILNEFKCSDVVIRANTEVVITYGQEKIRLDALFASEITRWYFANNKKFDVISK